MKKHTHTVQSILIRFCTYSEVVMTSPTPWDNHLVVVINCAQFDVFMLNSFRSVNEKTPALKYRTVFLDVNSFLENLSFGHFHLTVNQKNNINQKFRFVAVKSNLK